MVDVATEAVLQTYDSSTLGIVKPTGISVDRNTCTHIIAEQGTPELVANQRINFLDNNGGVIIILPPPPDPVPL